MPGMRGVICDVWDADFRKIPEALSVKRRVALPDPPKQIALAKLWNSQRRGNVRQIVFVARLADLVTPRTLRGVAAPGVPRQAMKAHDSHSLGPLLVFS